MMFSNQPLTPQQLALLRRRMDSAQTELTYGGMPTDIGSGLQRLGTAIGYAAMKHRYNSQFPDAPPPPPGAMPQQQNKPPIQGIVEALSGNRMPWQFPAAPSAPPSSTATFGPIGGGTEPAPQFPKPGGLFGLGGIFGRKSAGGLW